MHTVTEAPDFLKDQAPTVEDLHGDARVSPSALIDSVEAEMALHFGWDRVPTDETMQAMYAEDCRRNEEAARPQAVAFGLNPSNPRSVAAWLIENSPETLLHLSDWRAQYGEAGAVNCLEGALPILAFRAWRCEPDWTERDGEQAALMDSDWRAVARFVTAMWTPADQAALDEQDRRILDAIPDTIHTGHAELALA